MWKNLNTVIGRQLSGSTVIQRMASGPSDYSSAQFVTTSADIRGSEASNPTIVNAVGLKWMKGLTHNDE